MVAAQQALDEGTLALEQGDFAEAEKMYQKSLDVKETAIGQFPDVAQLCLVKLTSTGHLIAKLATISV